MNRADTTDRAGVISHTARYSLPCSALRPSAAEFFIVFMIASPETPTCSPEQHAVILQHVRLGRLFELMDWVAEGLPTLIPDAERIRTKDSPIREAIQCENHSMVRFLWEKCWQRQWEADSLVSAALWDCTAAGIAIAKYLLSQGLPLGSTLAYDGG